MDYKTKIKQAEIVVTKITDNQNIDSIKSTLKDEGFYDKDIIEIMVSARNILGEKYSPKIKEYLIKDSQIKESPEFVHLDEETLDVLIDRELQKLALEEKHKIIKSLKEGKPQDQVYREVDQRFLSAEKAAEHIQSVQQVQEQNSGSGRMINIMGGIGLIVLTGIIVIVTNRLFYVLPIIGMVMIVKGFVTKKVEVD